MAEPVIETAVQVLVEKLIAVAADEIRLMLGVKTELTKLKKSLVRIQALLHDAARKEVKDETVKLWLKDLENVAYQADNILDEFQYETHRRKDEIQNKMKHKVCFSFFSCTNPLVFRSEMAHKIRDVIEKLNALYREANRQGLEKIILHSSIARPLFIETNALSVDPIVVGRENDASKILDILINPSEEVVSIIPIVGMGGLGKTTLARSIFKDPKTIHHFDETIWVCVSDNFDSNELFNRMLKSLDDDHVQEKITQVVLKKLQKKLSGKTYLLILDDLWNDNPNEWENFKSDLLGISSNRGNFILTTTRLETVASLVTSEHIFSLSKLSNDDCWTIIKNRAFYPKDEEVPREFMSIGTEIACRCGGLPLAASMIGATLRGKRKDVWTSVLKDGLSDSNKENGVQKILKISTTVCHHYYLRSASHIAPFSARMKY